MQNPINKFLTVIIIFSSFVFPKLKGFSQNLYSTTSPKINAEKYFLDSADFHLTLKTEFLGSLISDTFVEKKSVLKKIVNPHTFKLPGKNNLLAVKPEIAAIQGTASVFGSGLSFSININRKLFIKAQFVELNAKLMSDDSFFADSLKTVPHFGNYFAHTGNYFGFTQTNFSITYKPADYILFEAGNGKHFFGAGYRSLFLSDYSAEYPYFKTEVSAGLLKYVWLISKHNQSPVYGSQSPDFITSKLNFTHYLSVNFLKRINFVFFETLVSSNYDSEYNKTGYDWSYFNPLVFYRPVEFAEGTTDNALLGFGLNFKIFKSTYIYSQFLLDDLIISELIDGNGWWGNKYGFQSGLKTYNLFSVKNLFMLAEFNIVSPYTYSHYTHNINYTHKNTSLSHPEGANFKEFITYFNYNKAKFNFILKTLYLQKGLDFDTQTSYGSNIFLSYEMRPSDYGIYILQGNYYSRKEINPEINFIINQKTDLHFILGYKYSFETYNSEKVKQNFYYLGISTQFFGNNFGFFL